jgi:hypothetical protein
VRFRRMGRCRRLDAPSWQDLSSRRQHWSVQPCVRPLDAVHMTAGHNALRESGPDQKLAFDNAMALVGCPDRRIDRLCITCCSPSQPSHHAGCPARSRLRRKCDGFLVSLALSHHGPGHSGKLVGKRNGGDLGRSPGQQCREPGAVFGAVHLGIADDGECTGDEQAAQIAVTLFADAAEPVRAAAGVLPRNEPDPGRESCVLIGRSWGQQHWRPERLPASDRRLECNEGACSFR